MGKKFGKDPLAVEQNNHESKIVNVYTAYDLDAWPRNPTNSFKYKNCLFGVISVAKIVIKKSIFIVLQHLVVQVYGSLMMTLLKML